MPAEQSPSAAVATYAYVARPFGGEVRLSLCGSALEIDAAQRAKRMKLARIRSVRLAFEPRHVFSRGYRVSLDSADGERVSFTNLSWKSMIETVDQAAAFRAFVAALLPAIAAANPGCRFAAGRPRSLWLLLAATSLGLFGAFGWMALGWTARLSAPTAVLLAAFVALFGWTVGEMVWRNRPRAFEPAAPPADLLPGA